jgi:hypothetical protein
LAAIGRKTPFRTDNADDPADELRRQPDVSGAEPFGKSLTINPGEIKF